PRHAEPFKQQMLATYLAYFRASYTGNRAPLHIGHHFEALQGGVYNEALKAFARRVCGLPEVRCAAYSELADFMDRQSPGLLAAYQRGDFPHAAPTTAAAALPPGRGAAASRRPWGPGAPPAWLHHAGRRPERGGNGRRTAWEPISRDATST